MIEKNAFSLTGALSVILLIKSLLMIGLFKFSHPLLKDIIHYVKRHQKIFPHQLTFVHHDD